MQQCGRLGGGHDKDLRSQLIQEIEHKSKQCGNPTYRCSIPRIDGCDYCIRHILNESTTTAYRQCTFVYTNGRKCPNALLKNDTKKDPALTTMCYEHSRRTQLQKTRTTVGKLVRVDTNEALLQNITHHINVDGLAEQPKQPEQDEEIDVVSSHVHPYVNHENINDLGTIVGSIKKRKRILDYASDSSSEGTSMPTLANTSRGFENVSDDDSVDSHDEDLLKRAGVFTRQEAIRMSEAKLTKLQGLYIEQINRLHYMIKEQRRRYLHNLRKERETLCSIHDQVRHDERERYYFDRLKALNTYHRRHGVEAVLYKKFKDKRANSSAGLGHGRSATNFTKCVYTEGGVKCGERTLPCCKYCRKHILEDKKQTLFKACAVEKSGVVCQDPVLAIFDDSTCPLHLVAPPQRQYIQRKYESDTEDEEMDVKPKISTAKPEATGDTKNVTPIAAVDQPTSEAVKMES